MGNKMVALTGTNSLKCSKDADCYVAFATAGVVAATTTAEKAKRCCYVYGVQKAPEGTNKATGDAYLLAAKTAYGVPNTVDEYTKYCQFDYPTLIAGLKSSPTVGTYDFTKAVFTATDAYGKFETRQFCHGGASNLAIASVAAIGLAVSI